MKLLKHYVIPAALVALALTAAVAALLVLANVFFPDLSAQSGLGFDTVGGTVAGQLTAVTQLTGLSPLTDLILFVASYILVCILLWIQAELRMYLSNRSHFR